MISIQDSTFESNTNAMGEPGYGHIGFSCFSHRASISRVIETETIWTRNVCYLNHYDKKYDRNVHLSNFNPIRTCICK